jgi:mono/diheme cytochrome c family protein
MRPDRLLLLIGLVVATPATAASFDFGHPATAADIAAWNIDVSPDGSGLPPGQGSVKIGAEVFAAHCAACHGGDGASPVDKSIGRLVGGKGTLTSGSPVPTIGSYWPYATTLFDYVRRAMPLDAPGSLNADQVYAVAAYLLHLNGILAEDAVLDRQNLPRIVMPNRNGFVAVKDE